MRWLYIFLILSSKICAQYFDSIPIEKKIAFVRFLKDNRQLDDARFFLHSINEQVKADSLRLLEVKLLLDQRKEKEAESLLQTISADLQNDPDLKCSHALLMNHARLMSARYDSLHDPACGHQHHRDQWRLQLLAQSLFRKNTEEFEMVFNAAKCDDPILSVVEFALYVQKEDLRRTPKKSPFLAGALSTLFPGTGKLYAGKPREAIYAFLPIAFNLAQAGEGYYYEKLKSPHLYFFGAVGGVFYVSNIYGSARAAKRKNEENDFKIKSNIEFEISKLTKYY
jgi:hypothetical protein